MTKAQLLAELGPAPVDGYIGTCFIGAALGSGAIYRDKHNSMIFFEVEDDFAAAQIKMVEMYVPGDYIEVVELERIKWGDAARAEAGRCADAHERAMKVLIRMKTGLPAFRDTEK